MTQTAKEIDEEAARWAVRLHAGALPPPEQHELDAWLSESVRHQGALVRARATWINLDRLAALSARAQLPASDEPPRIGRRRALAAGIALTLLAGAGAWLVQRERGETFASEIGEQRQISLTDGSGMLLNTASEANVRYVGSQREVRLLQGEALFEVVKDRTRPFVVHVGNLTATAVGTAFVVRRIGERTEVIVTEGVVEIARDDGVATEPPRRVTANQIAVATKAEPLDVQSLTPAEAERRLAWRGGRVSFDGETLSEAVAEINRYNRRRIVIADPALAARPVVGIFNANDTETFASAAAAVLGAQVVDKGDVIELREGKAR
jgi:transmembrane sensor